MITHGISSYGGFIGATVGGIAWRVRNRTSILPFADQLSAVLPIGWMFGRGGCSIAHDHIGRLSTSPLAVDFPGGPRFDLGLLELLCTIPIAIVMLVFARKARPRGAVTGLLCVLYAPVRYFLDSLRATDIVNADARYFGLTPAMWLSIGLLAVGVALLVNAYFGRGRGAPGEPPARPDAEEEAASTGAAADG